MGYVFFKGLCLLFLPNVPGTTFILGATFIPDSRVGSQNQTKLKVGSSNGCDDER